MVLFVSIITQTEGFLEMTDCSLCCAIITFTPQALLGLNYLQVKLEFSKFSLHKIHISIFYLLAFFGGKIFKFAQKFSNFATPPLTPPPS